MSGGKEGKYRERETEVLPSSSNIVTVITSLPIGMDNMSFVGVAIMTKKVSSPSSILSSKIGTHAHPSIVPVLFSCIVIVIVIFTAL